MKPWGTDPGKENSIYHGLDVLISSAMGLESDLEHPLARFHLAEDALGHSLYTTLDLKSRTYQPMTKYHMIWHSSYHIFKLVLDLHSIIIALESI